MADEKKTYLINIESNLKKYADEAAAAKVKVDELKAANDLLKKSGQENTAEYQLGIAAQKAAQKEYAQTLRNIGVLTSANKENATTRDKLNAIVTIETQKLKALGDGYTTNSDGLKKVNPLYIQQKQNVAAANLAIINYDQSLNKGGTNVGRYGASVKAAIGEAASSMFAFAAPIAVATAALNGLKEAFLGTEAGAKLLGRAKLQLSAFFESIVTGKFGYAFGSQLPKDIKAVADLMDKIRIDQRNELVIVAQKEKEIKDLRLESVKAGKGTVEQENLLIEAQTKEEELIAYKVGQKEEELSAVNILLEKQSTNTILLNQQAQLEAEILNIKGEKSLRMATKLQAIDEKRVADAEKNLAKAKTQEDKDFQFFIDYWDKIDKKTDEETKKAQEKFNAYWDAKDAIDREREKTDIAAGFEYQKLKAGSNLDTLNTILDAEYGNALASTEYQRSTRNEQLLIDQQYTDAKQELSLIRMDQQLQELDAISSIAGSVSELFGKQTIAAKGLSVAQALISTYTAGVKAMAELPLGSGPVLRFVTLAAVIAAGLGQVKNILAVKIPGGGGDAPASIPTAISSSVPAQRASSNPVGSTILTQQQLSQNQLNALPNQNLLTADDIARALSNMPPPVVTVEAYEAVAKSKTKIEVRANI